MVRQLFLDPHSDNLPPPGSLVVEDPVAFVEHAFRANPLLVRGARLCQWADDFGFGRGWQSVWLGSPVQELMLQCPSLHEAEAKTIITAIGDTLLTLDRPLRIRDVIVSSFGGTLWSEEPGPDHASRWLMWLAQQKTEGAEWKLVWQHAAVWQSVVESSLRLSYSARSAADAWGLLKEWLGVSNGQQKWPQPPPKLADALLQRLDEDFIREAIDTDTDSFSELLGHASDKVILRSAAKACAQVLLSNPEKVTPDRVARLKTYLRFDTWQKLIELIPEENPGLPEWRFDSLSDWFTTKYLPYRAWTLRPENAGHPSDWVLNSAREFARLFLQYYSTARAGGEGAGHLAWAKTKQLKAEGKPSVHLLVVLDGLTYPDAVQLKSIIAQQSRRLALDEETLALAPIPTITDFAKPAVSKGILPAEASQDADHPICTSEEQVSSALKTATPGSLFVWTLLEPDRTYHFRVDAGPADVRREVDGQLSIIANHIVAVAEAAPEKLRLHVVVTSDHGRLLTSAERKLPIPAGMAAHGRAAWGNSVVSLEGNGFRIAGDVAYLHPTPFGLPQGQLYAVAVNEQAFLTADERGGREPFPHGGLFPEEVLVPWLEFTRDRAPLTVDAALHGKGEESKPGNATLAVQNPNAVHLTLALLRISRPELSVALDLDIGPLSQRSITVQLEQWPSKQDLESIVAHLVYVTPDGERTTHEFRPQLETETLYDKIDILGELGGL